MQQLMVRWFNYRKVGGLHFVKLGRFGFSFYVSRRVAHGQVG